MLIDSGAQRVDPIVGVMFAVDVVGALASADVVGVDDVEMLAEQGLRCLVGHRPQPGAVLLGERAHDAEWQLTDGRGDRVYPERATAVLLLELPAERPARAQRLILPL